MKRVNEYTKNIDRIEFSVTNACNSRCRHCLVDHQNTAQPLEKKAASALVRTVAEVYEINSLLTFGGEPLLCPETVEAIQLAAAEAGIPKRQLITNGGALDEAAAMEKQADWILSCGINQILLSVDTFHMEFIPLVRQHSFAKILMDRGFAGLRLNPVWVGGFENDNIFNRETRECLKIFEDLGVLVEEGNVVRPEGKAKRYLERFYKRGEFSSVFRCGEMPYTDRLDSPTVIFIEPNGDVAVCGFPIGNLYRQDILEILELYDPYQNPMMAALLWGGIEALQRYMESLGFEIDLKDYYTPCEFCREMRNLQKNRE